MKIEGPMIISSGKDIPAKILESGAIKLPFAGTNVEVSKMPVGITKEMLTEEEKPTVEVIDEPVETSEPEN